MNFVTFLQRYSDGDLFHVLIATGPDTKPTSDGGPWAIRYEVPHRERGRLREISENAERMLFGMLRTHAPEVHARAIELGWASPPSGTDR